MSSETPKGLSAKQVAANRLNAKKSTGPRSPAGKVRSSHNGFKDGWHAQGSPVYLKRLFASMPELGEDPQEFQHLRESHIQSFQPADGAQAALVDEIVLLRWERLRLVRAQTALLARRVQKLEVKRQRKNLEMSQKISLRIPASQIAMGLIWAEDSPTKFHQLLEWLECLKYKADDNDFNNADHFLDWIYGPNPTARGAWMREAFKQLGKAPAKQPPDNAEVVTLRRELLAEHRNIAEQYQLHIKQNIELTPTMREECLVPGADQRWLVRQMNMIDRQIERKTWLLLGVQRTMAVRSERMENRDAEDSAPSTLEGAAEIKENV